MIKGNSILVSEKVVHIIDSMYTLATLLKKETAALHPLMGHRVKEILNTTSIDHTNLCRQCSYHTAFPESRWTPRAPTVDVVHTGAFECRQTAISLS